MQRFAVRRSPFAVLGAVTTVTAPSPPHGDSPVDPQPELPMLPEALIPETVPAKHPTISDVVEDATGRSFTVRFQPGQRLLDHKNSHRVTIMAVHGHGILTVAGGNPRQIHAGEMVQLDPNVVHAVEALSVPLEIQVVLRPNCCESC
jgi:quercetin dioxygenase-like cupin family protein